MKRKSPHLGLTFGGHSYDGGAELLTGRNLILIGAEIARIADAKSVQVDIELDTGVFHSDAGLERTAHNNLNKIRTALLALGAEDDPVGTIKLTTLDGGSMLAMWQTLLRIDATLMALAEGAVPMTWVDALPPSVRYDVGDRIEFAVTVEGGIQPYVYEWRNGAGTTYPSQTNRLLLSASAGVAFNGVRVICKVSDQSGAFIETGVNIAVVAPLVWTTPMAPATVAEGNSHTFSVVASGGVLPYTYAWTDGVSQGSIGTGASLTLDATQVLAGDGRTYTCTVRDAEQNEITTSGKLTVDRIPALAFTTQLPAAKSVNETDALGLTVAVTGGVPPYSYAWTDGGSILGSDAPSLNIPATEALNGKTIRCQVEDARQARINSSCLMTVVLPPAITFPVALPSTYSAVAGTGFTLTVEVAGGVAPYTYAWTIGGTTQGGNSASLTAVPTEAMNGSVVKVVVTDSRGRKAESLSTLTVTAPAPDPEPEPGDDLAAGGDWTVGRGVAHGFMVDTQMMGPDVPYWMAYDGVYGSVVNGSQRDGEILVALAATSTPEDNRVAVTFAEPGKTIPASMAGCMVEFHYNGVKLAEAPVDSAGRWVALIPTFPEITEAEPAKVVIHGPSDFIKGADHFPEMGDWRTGAGTISGIKMLKSVYDTETTLGFSQFRDQRFPRNGRIADYCLQVIAANTYTGGTGQDRMFLYFANSFGGAQSYKTEMAGRAITVRYGSEVLWTGLLDENATATWPIVDGVVPFPENAELTIEIAAP